MKKLMILYVILAGCMNVATPAVIEDPVVTDKKTRKFVVETIDRGILVAQQGRLAMQRSAIPEIKEYGTLIMQDQLMMLEDFRKAAAVKNIIAPMELSKNRNLVLQKLENAPAEQFDKLFMKMIFMEYNEGIQAYLKARLNDADIQILAEQYVSMLRLHIGGLDAVKEYMQRHHLPA